MKSKSSCIWVLLLRVPKGFLIFPTIRRCTRAVWVANISQIFDDLVLPLKVVKVKHPFGILQSITQIRTATQNLAQTRLLSEFFILETVSNKDVTDS